MPEINPLTKDQLFEKKIAENTGSNYNVGDISDVVPVTKDQSLLKEIALNSAGQSEDITELEGKVTANAEAIEAMVNVNGCCNIFDNKASSDTIHNVSFTVNSNKSVTANGTSSENTFFMLLQGYPVPNEWRNRPLKISGCRGGSVSTYRLYLGDQNWDYIADSTDGPSSTFIISDSVTTLNFMVCVYSTTVNNITFEPMIYDARLTPTGYVPYAMTNRELTDDVKWLKDKTFVLIPAGDSFSYNVEEKGYFVAINRQDDAGAIYYTSGNTVTRIAGSDVVDQMISISNRVVTITNNVSGTIHASIF